MIKKGFVVLLVICFLLCVGFSSVHAREIIGFSNDQIGANDLFYDCPPVPNTPNFTFAYGTAQINASPAPIGTTILARSPRGDVVGCTVITTTGYYGAMYIYGEDTSVLPVIPGMRPGETVSFYLVNLSGIPSPTFTYTNDRDLHEVNLSATGESAPLANFSSDKINGTAPLSVQFTNLTIGAATNWLWNFGDGNSSTLQNPSHTYASKGVYTVSLTATGSAGSTTETKQNYITVYDGAIANFTASDTNGVAPLAIDFTNTSTGDYSTSFWAFGDGSTSTQANPSHTYLTSGVYSVSLIVSGLGSSDSEIKTNYITVNQPVSADFAANTTNGIAPLLVDFNNESTGDYSSYNWTFGDGATSIQANPSHTYLTSGTYSVSFTVSGSGGSDTETKTNYITVYQPVSANFSATPTSGKQPFLVRFTNTSLGDYDTVFWDFGDGGSSLEQNPDHLYITNGIFTVSLTISGNGGTDEVIKMGYIVVNDLNYIFLPMLLR